MNMHEAAHDEEEPIYVISVAARIVGMHAQTLRQYERVGLVEPSDRAATSVSIRRRTSPGCVRCSG